MPTVTRYATGQVTGGNASFTNPGNVSADDGAEATFVTSRRVDHTTRWGGFDFDSIVPEGATIDQITYTMEARESAAQSMTGGIRRSLNGVLGTETTNTNLPTTATVVQRTDNPSGVTRDQILDANNFAVQTRFNRDGSNNANALIDYIRVTVVYSEAGAGPTNKMAMVV